MISVSEISWRNYAIESFSAFFLAFMYFLLLLRVPGTLIHIFMSMVLVTIFIVCKKHILAFGNPVVTVAMIGLRKIHWYAGLAIVSLQLCFASLAGVLVRSAFDVSRMGSIENFTKFSWSASAAEAIGGFLLVAGILAMVNNQKNDSTVVTTEFSLLVVAFVSMIIPALIGSIGVVNPGSAFALGLFRNITYVISPIVGGILGGLFYSVVVDEQSFRSLLK